MSAWVPPGVVEAVRFAAAKADLCGSLSTGGEESALKSMEHVLSQLLGYHVTGEYGTGVLHAWENVSLLADSTLPIMRFDVFIIADLGRFKQAVEVDVSMMKPENIPAMKVMWG